MASDRASTRLSDYVNCRTRNKKGQVELRLSDLESQRKSEVFLQIFDFHWLDFIGRGEAENARIEI